MSIPQHKNTCSGDHEIYNFGKHFLGYHCIIPSISYLCLTVEKKILKEIMHFTIKIMWPCPSTRTRVPGVINLFVDPTLIFIILELVCLIYAWKEMFTIWHIWPCPSTRTSAPGVIKCSKVDPSWVIITKHSLSELIPWSREDLKKKQKNYLLPQKYHPLGCRGHEIYNFFVS